MHKKRISFWHHAFKALVLFLCGGSMYAVIELLWRGHTHWTMAIIGGLCFLLVGGINNILPCSIPLLLQAFLGGLIVTLVEFASGLMLNVWLGLELWDYSGMPGNFLGQICPQFTLAWCGLSFVAIIADDYLRHWLFKEPRPHYHLLKFGGDSDAE